MAGHPTMKIWILTSETPFNQPGGIARYVHNFATSLGAAGHQVTVFCRGTEEAEKHPAPGYRLVVFRTREGDVKPLEKGGDAATQPAFPYNIFSYWMAVSWDYARVVAGLAAREGPPDVIESQEYMGIAYFLLHRRLVDPDFLPGVPVVLHLHSPDFILRRINHDPRWQLPFYWSGQMEKFCILAADALLCPSHSMAAEVRSELEEPDLPIETIPLPWTEIPEAVRGPGQSNCVCYFGRIEMRKGVIRLLEACEQLWQAGLDFQLRLIGGTTHYSPKDRPLDEYLKDRHANRLAEGRLIFQGHLDHPELFTALAEAAVVVIPSLWENFPNTCIEAMSLEKVVVASRHGGQVQMIGEDGQAGFLFDWARPEEFDHALRSALALNREERLTLGRHARARVAQMCAPARVVERRLAHFRKIIDAGVPVRSRYPFVNRPQRLGQVRPLLPGSAGRPDLVSAIIPFYNLGDYLIEAVDSVLASDYRPLEIVIVNDGSTDPASRAALETIRARRDATIRILDVPNGGLARARNLGAEAAAGEILLLVDADDAVEPALAGEAVRAFQRYSNVHWVYPWIRYFGEIDGLYSTWNAELPYLLAHNMLIPICAVRRSAFLSFGRNKPEMLYGLEDYESWVGLMEAGCGGLSLPRILGRYRVRQNSMFRTLNRAQLQYLYEVIVHNHGDLYRRYSFELFHLQNANGPGLWWNQPACWVAPIEELGQKAWRFDHELVQKDIDLRWNMAEVQHLYKLRDSLQGELAEARGQIDRLADRLAQVQASAAIPPHDPVAPPAPRVSAESPHPLPAPPPEKNSPRPTIRFWQRWGRRG